MTLPIDNIEADLKVQSAAIVDEAIAVAGVTLDDLDRRALVHFTEGQAITVAEFMTGAPAEILAECARVSRLLVAHRLSGAEALA